MHLAILIISIFLGGQAIASNIADIPLISSKPYDPKKESGRGFKKFTSGLGIFFFGSLFKPDQEDLKKDILKELKRPELEGYFTKKQMETLANRVSKKVSSTILNKKITNAKAIEATHYSVTELVSEIIDRIMEKEGVTSEEHRAQWAQKILRPFHNCIKKTKTMQEAEKCQKSLQLDLVKNIGLGISFELAEQAIGTKYATKAGKEYLACITKKNKNNSHVKPCVMQTMQNAVFNYGKESLYKIAKVQSPKDAKSIVDQLSPAFKKCLSKTTDRSGLVKCADQLTKTGGATIAELSIIQSQELIDNIPALKDRKKIGANAKLEFESCIEENIQNNKRDKKGSVLTENCEIRVKNEVTQLALKALFSKNINTSMNGSDQEKANLISKTNLFFEKCWKDESSAAENNVCVKNSVVYLVNGIAAGRLKTDLPASVNNQGFRDTLLQKLNTCLGTKLPSDILGNSKTIKADIDFCTQSLTKHASLAVAEIEIKSALRERVKDETRIDSIVNQTVKIDFSQCLEKANTNVKIDQCSIDLRRSIGKIIATELFPEEFDKFIKPNGGLSAYQLTEENRKVFLAQLLEAHNKCLNETIRIEKLDSSTTDLNFCFNNSIKTFTLFLAEKEFQRTVRLSLNIPEQSIQNYSKRFTSDFEHCLSSSSQLEPLGAPEFLKLIENCKTNLTQKYTLLLAKDQLNENLNKYFTAKNEPADRSRDIIENSLNSAFEACLTSASKDSAARQSCIESFREKATANIVLLAGQKEAKTFLNSETLPQEIVSVESDYKECQENKKRNCPRIYVIKLAKTIGALKLTHSLGGALGKNVYEDSATAIENFKKTYFECLDSIKSPYVDDALVHEISVCGGHLQEQTIAFLQDKTAKWISETQNSEQGIEIATTTGIALPCLNKLIPSSVYDDRALSNLEAEGTLEAVSKLIGGYIKYDTEQAGKSVDEVLQSLLIDLQSAGPLEAREKLIHSLVEKGVLDQFLKSMIQKEVLDSFANLPESDKISKELQAKLASKETLDAILSPQVLSKFRPILAEKILRPILIDGKKLKDPGPQASMNLIRNSIGSILLSDEKFGGAIISHSVQKQLDNLGWVNRGLIKFNYGEKSLDWSVVRKSTRGAIAEDYVRIFILRPKFTGQMVSAEEQETRVKKASDLITDAISQVQP